MSKFELSEQIWRMATMTERLEELIGTKVYYLWNEVSYLRDKQKRKLGRRRTRG